MPVSTSAATFLVLPVVTFQASGASRSASTLPVDWPELLRAYCVPKLGSWGTIATSARGEPSGAVPRGMGFSPKPPALRRLRSSSRSTCSHALNCLLCCRCLMEGDLTGVVEMGRPFDAAAQCGRTGSGSVGVGVLCHGNYQRLRLSELRRASLTSR